MTDKTQALLPVTRHPTQVKGNCPTCGHGQSHSLPGDVGTSPVLALVAGYADYTAISDDRWEQGKAAGYRELGGLVAAALTPSATMEGVMRAAAISSSEHRYDASALSGDAGEGRTWPTGLTQGLREILGIPNFQCGPMAHAYQKIGEFAGDDGLALEKRAEDEQAFMLHKLLCFWFEHGDDWREPAIGEIDRAAKAARAAHQGAER